MDKSKMAVEIFDKYAKVYQDKFMDVSLYTESLSIFCKSIAKKNADVLELACGPGNITNYLLKEQPDYTVFGIDLSENMIELAKINNPGTKFKVMDCREIEKIKNSYDGVMCGFCLPYLSKTETSKLIHDTSGLLKPGGVFYLSTMEGDDCESGFKKGSTGEEMYMNYYQADYLIKTLQKNGFEILNIDRKSYSANGTTTTDLIIISKKNLR